jgi:hypothetical protein
LLDFQPWHTEQLGLGLGRFSKLSSLIPHQPHFSIELRDFPLRGPLPARDKLGDLGTTLLPAIFSLLVAQVSLFLELLNNRIFKATLLPILRRVLCQRATITMPLLTRYTKNHTSINQ